MGVGVFDDLDIDDLATIRMQGKPADEPTWEIHSRDKEQRDKIKKSLQERFGTKEYTKSRPNDEVYYPTDEENELSPCGRLSESQTNFNFRACKSK